MKSVRQVALADHILIAKLDLVPATERAAARAAIEERLRSLNPVAAIHAIDDPGLDAIALLNDRGIDPATGDEAAKKWLNLPAYEHHDHDHEHDHDHHDHAHFHHHNASIASFAFIREEPTSRYALQLLLNALEKNLGPNLLRVKGLVNVKEEPDRPAVIQGAQHLLHNISWLDRWPDQDRRTQIVFITQNFERADIEEMIGLLDRVATRTAAARAKARNTC